MVGRTRIHYQHKRPNDTAFWHGCRKKRLHVSGNHSSRHHCAAALLQREDVRRDPITPGILLKQLAVKNDPLVFLSQHTELRFLDFPDLFERFRPFGDFVSSRLDR